MAKIEKIYQITLAGEDNLIARMKTVNQLFEESKKRWKELKIEVAKGLTAADLAQYKLMLQQAKLETERLRQESIKLRNESISLTNQNKQNAASQRQAREEARNSVNDYQRLNQQYKEAKNNALNLGAALGVESREFKEASAEAQKHYNKLRQIEAGVGVFNRNVGNYASSIKQYFSSIKGELASFALGFLSIQTAITKITELKDNTYELTDAVTSLEVELGKSAGGIQYLVDKLESIDTRTPLKQLVDMANTAVKAGVDESQVVGVVSAVDQIKTAFGKDFGDVETGTESLVKLINVFEQGDISEEKMLKMGNAVRTLANESVASVPYLNDFSKRMAGLKGISEISLPSVLGLASGFEQFGQSAETSSTALVRIIPKLASDTEKFAKIAGMTRKEFSQLINTNPAEALIKVSEGITKNKGSIEDLIQSLGDSELAKKGGAGIVSALGVLGKNSEKFRETIASAVKAYSNTSNITEAFEKKNQNLSASMDKLKKRFTDLANNQSFQKMVSNTITLILLLSQVITGIPYQVWIGLITLLTLAYYENLKAIVANGVGMASYIARQIIGNALITASTILFRAQAIAIGVATIAWRLLNATVLLFSGIIPGLRAAWISLNLTMMLTPIGWVVAGMVAIGAAVVFLSEKTEDATEKMKKQGQAIKQSATEMKLNAEITKKAAEATSDTIAKMDMLTRIVKDNSISLNTRKKALEELISINPKYLSALTLENIKTAEGIKILDAYRKMIIEVAKAKAAEQLLQEKSKRLFELEMQAADDARAKTEADKFKNDIFDKRSWGEFGRGVGGLIGIGEGDAEDKFNSRLKERIQLQKEINVLSGKVVKNVVEGKTDISGGGDTSTNEDDKKKEKKYNGSRLTGTQKDYLKDLEATRNQALAIIEKQYTEGQILEIEYIEKSLATNLDYFNKKIAYLKSGNAEERKQEAQAQLDKSKAVREANDKLYALNKKRLDDELKKNEDDVQRKRDTVINNPYSTEQEKINAEKTYHSESTTAQLKYNQDMIDLENKLSKSMIEEANARNRVLQQKLDEENSNNLQSRINTLKADVSDVDKVKDQVDNQNEINAAVAKRNILGDKRLDQQRKENELSLINAQLVLSNTNAELGAVISKITLYEQEITKRKLTNDELREYNRLLKEKATLEGQKAEGEVNVTNAQGKSKSSGNGVPGSGMSGLANVATKGALGSDGKMNIAGVDVSESAAYAIAQGFSIAEQAMNSYFDAERDRIERSRQLAYDRIDLEKEQLLRYAQTNGEREAIDKQAAAKKKKADKEAGEQLKKTKKAEAKIAFLMELANIWSTVWQLGPIAGPIMGGIFTALAGVKYAMTIGNINKTQYKRGGLFGLGGRLDGPSHSNGGMPVINPVTGEKVAEMEGKEGIINADSMQDNNVYTITGKPSQIASKINSIGGGVDWFGGATISKFKSGGLFNWNRAQPPVFNSQIQKFEEAEKQSETNDRMDRAERIIEALAKEQTKKVVVSSKEMSKSQKENFKQTEIGTL